MSRWNDSLLFLWLSEPSLCRGSIALWLLRHEFGLCRERPQLGLCRGFDRDRSCLLWGVLRVYRRIAM